MTRITRYRRRHKSFSTTKRRGKTRGISKRYNHTKHKKRSRRKTRRGRQRGVGGGFIDNIKGRLPFTAAYRQRREKDEEEFLEYLRNEAYVSNHEPDWKAVKAAEYNRLQEVQHAADNKLSKHGAVDSLQTLKNANVDEINLKGAMESASAEPRNDY